MGGAAMIDARLLTKTLSQPSYATRLDARGWTSLLTIAHAERLTASLAWRLDGLNLPPKAAAILAEAKASAEVARTHALWEAEMARRVLTPLGIPLILLKGTAFAAAGLEAARGRLIGDLDILVPRDRLAEVEAALLGGGWEWVKPDPYDDAYYRQYMHELPPLIHRMRDRMIDVHHTILPLTARVKPDAAALIADAVPLNPFVSSEVETSLDFARDERSLIYTLSPSDMLIHAVAHLFADGDLNGGLRNLWDIDRLIREHSVAPDYWEQLTERARLHGLVPHVSRALRLSQHLFETPVDPFLAYEARRGDIFYMGRLLARNGWGQETRKILRLAFYIRSHWLRMPPLMLARHLWVKWRRG
jgi:Uncharacterised nucleotidyltransferase